MNYARFGRYASLAAALVSGLGFLCLYLFRAELYAVTEVAPAILAELYPVAENAVAIAGFETSPGPHLTIKLHNTDDCSRWRLESENQPPIEVDGGNPRIPVRPGTHDYALHPIDCVLSAPSVGAIILNLHFGYAESFGAQALTADQFGINKANVPVLMTLPATFSRWVPDAESFSPAEAQQAKAMLAEAGFDPSAPTRSKIEFLTTLIRDRMPGGSPPVRLNTISPWSVFMEKHDRKSGNFCRQWSLSYGYLANLAGIPTRNLFTGGAMANVDMGSHAFSESYIAEEARWAYVDPTNNIAYVTNTAGEVLSGADIYLASVTGNEQGLIARALKESEIASVSYPAVSKGVRHFMHRENFLIYVGDQDGLYQMQGDGAMKYARKLYRFLFQPKQYFGYTHFVSYHWLRPAVFFLFLISATSFILLVSAPLIRRRRSRFS